MVFDFVSTFLDVRVWRFNWSYLAIRSFSCFPILLEAVEMKIEIVDFQHFIFKRIIEGCEIFPGIYCPRFSLG